MAKKKTKKKEEDKSGLTIEFKNRHIEPAFNSLKALAQGHDFHPKTRIGLVRRKRILANALGDLLDAHKDLLSKYVDVEADERLTEDMEGWDEYKEEFDALLDQPVDVDFDPITVSMLGDDDFKEGETDVLFELGLIVDD